MPELPGLSYQPDEEVRLEVRMEDETVWLTHEEDFPQRHRIAGNAAVVATRLTNQAGRQQHRLFEVLRGAENGVDRPVDAHAVGVDN